MNIALVTHNVLRGDGQGYANYQLVRHILRRGHSVTLFADRVAPEIVEAGAKWSPIHTRLRVTNLTHGIEFALKANKRLQKVRRDFDVLHGCGHTIDLPQDISTTHFVHTAWLKHPQHVARAERTVNAKYQWLYTYVNGWYERQVYAKAKRIIAVSEQVKNELIESGVAPQKLYVGRNGVDLNDFQPGHADRAALKLPIDVPLALFVGDLRTRRKNMDTILAALVKAPGLHLAVGGKTDESPFPAMAEQLGVSDRVHFLGFRRDIPELMRATDFFVFPSRYEACALVLMEALASGLPVITAKTTGGAEVITPEAGVRLDEPSDVEGLAAAMRDLGGNPQKRQDMRGAARAIACENSWDALGESYLRHYEALL